MLLSCPLACLHLLQRHLAYLESQPAEHEVMLAGLNMLIKISYVDDTEVFKSCLDYWQLFVADIFGSCTTHALAGEVTPATVWGCSLVRFCAYLKPLAA